MDDFKSYPKIEQIGKLHMTITQKIHGTNAQIFIEKLPDHHVGEVWRIRAGSRTRWLSRVDDNYNFAEWVSEYQQELMRFLSEGRHFGEWCGNGINSGEGLPDKRFVLFEWWKWKDKELPLNMMTVPVLYSGAFSYEKIDEVMNELKEKGSRLAPGYMHPEGVVIDINGQKFKKVFDPEDTKWIRKKAPRIQSTPLADVSHLLQPKRLEKLLSRDEKYRREYPENLRQLFTDYYHDLLSEGHIMIDQPDIETIKKALGKEIYRFIRHYMENPDELTPHI